MPNIINTIPLYFTGITISLIYTYIVGAPMEQIALEILAPLPVTLQGSEYILVISDYFTKWTECYVISNQEATKQISWSTSSFPDLVSHDSYIVIKQPISNQTSWQKFVKCSTSRRPERRRFTHNRMARWNGSIEC